MSAGKSLAAETNDVELLKWISSGDVTAFEILYERYGRAMFSLCLRLLHEPTEAEEVTQEAFLRVWCQATRYDPARGSAATWLLTITHHLVIDHVRRRRNDAIPSSPHLDAATAVALDDPGDQAVTKVLGSQIRRAVRGLAPEQRQAIWLTHFAGFTQREVADALALPLGTVKSRVRLGLQNLRRAVGGPSRGEFPCP
jgi:RNA polymerase sigma-70 factor, ECF subfamily